jgi:RecA DNA recombination protein
LGQGRENAKLFLKENDEVRERILTDIYEKLGLKAPEESAVERNGSNQETAALYASSRYVFWMMPKGAEDGLRMPAARWLSRKRPSAPSGDPDR